MCQPITTALCLSAGDDVLSAYISPLLVDLLDAAIRQVNLRDEVWIYLLQCCFAFMSCYHFVISHHVCRHQPKQHKVFMFSCLCVHEAGGAS